MLDKFLAPTTQEAVANTHLTYVSNLLPVTTPHTKFFFANPLLCLISENWPAWATDQPSVDESLISGCASYRAFERYISGKDLFLLPRTRSELENVL